MRECYAGGSGSMTCSTEWAKNTGPMAPSSGVISKTEAREVEGFHGPTKAIMKVSSKIINLRGGEAFIGRMAASMKGSGRTI